MQTREEINELLKRFAESMPRMVMAMMEKTNIGIGVVLRCLEEAERPVSAGEISRYMNVSTARVAVLLRSMSEKGLIVKSGDSSDARKTLVSLSDKGREWKRKMNDELIGIMSDIVDKVGIERLELFFLIANEINAVVAAKTAEKQQ